VNTDSHHDPDREPYQHTRRTDLTYAVARLLETLPTDDGFTYGSPQWDALPDDDPAKWAAVLRAAELWRRHWQPEAITARLFEELARVDQQAARHRKAAAVDLSGTHDWAAQSRRPSHAEIQRRRTQPGPPAPPAGQQREAS